jgi:hypothetical protein
MFRCLSGLSELWLEVTHPGLYSLSTVLIRSPDDPRLPVHLLVYAVQTAVTTATCIADYLSWSDYENAQKIELGKLYVPYLALCAL